MNESINFVLYIIVESIGNLLDLGIDKGVASGYGLAETIEVEPINWDDDENGFGCEDRGGIDGLTQIVDPIGLMHRTRTSLTIQSP